MYYFTKIYEWGKCGVLGLGGLFGTGAIIYGITLAGTPTGILFIVGGSLWLLQSGMMIIDNRKLLRDIRREIVNLELGIDQFNAENLKLKVNIEGLDTLKSQYMTQIEKLTNNLKAMEDQMKALERLKEDYASQLNALSNSNKDLATSNQTLETNLDKLGTLKQSIQTKNEDLKVLLEQGRNQVQRLTEIKQEYEEENNQLQSLTDQQSEDLITLRTQVKKLGELYENSRKLMLNMAQASSVFDGFAGSLNEGLVRIDKTETGLSETLTGLNSFLAKLSETSFDMIDADGDNNISKEEFSAMAAALDD